MRKLQLLLPMGGLGKRFSDAGFSLPKPLIPVDGQPMFTKAASSFKDIPHSVTVVLRKEHEEQFGLATKVKAALPGVTVVIIEQLTRGAVETCIAAEKALSMTDGLVVLDCDLYFSSPQYIEAIKGILSGKLNYSGALTYHKNNKPHFSFLKLSGDEVTEIAEKRPISDNAIIGGYFFSKAADFFRVGKEMLKAPPNGAAEYYVSLVYAQLLKDGHKFTAKEAAVYNSFGTPDELRAYEAKVAGSTLKTAC